MLHAVFTVVEDSMPNRKLLCMLLKRFQCVVTAVEDGQQCVNICQERTFDLILMDNTMPVMDGMTATKILRGRGSVTPIVGVTGNALLEDLNAFQAAGANEILVRRRLLRLTVRCGLQRVHLKLC
jgi:CheY-like chemotaxis protein